MNKVESYATLLYSRRASPPAARARVGYRIISSCGSLAAIIPLTITGLQGPFIPLESSSPFAVALPPPPPPPPAAATVFLLYS